MVQPTPAEAQIPTPRTAAVHPEPPAGDQDLLILIHGIRTTAPWAQTFRPLLENQKLRVVIIPYGVFNTFQFLDPIFSRRRVVRYVESRLRFIMADHRSRYPTAKISILAHSFGAYVASQMLRRDPFMKLDNLVLCGSVLRRDFPIDILLRQVHTFVNDCGTKDDWPVIAESVTWGYGNSGTFGFGISAIDRFHDCGHSGFFDAGFVKKFWVPLFHHDQVEPSNHTAQMPTWRMRPFLFIPFRWLIVLLFLWMVWSLAPLLSQALAAAGVELPAIVIRHGLPDKVSIKSAYAEEPLEGLIPLSSGGGVESDLIQRLSTWKSWIKDGTLTKDHSPPQRVVVAQSPPFIDHYETFNAQVKIDFPWEVFEGAAFLVRERDRSGRYRPTYRQLDLVLPASNPDFNPNTLEINNPDPEEFLLLILRVRSEGGKEELPVDANSLNLSVMPR